MEIIILGSGTTVPLAERASPSLAVFTENEFILLDIGPGTVRQLTHAGLDHENVDCIAISHFHPDHTADLIHFIFATRYPPVLKRRKPFTVIGPRGLERFIGQLKQAYGTWLDLPDQLMRVDELSTNEQDGRVFQGFSIRSAPVVHTPQSIGLRIEDRSGKTIVYSGDTAYCEAIIDLANGADLLILESSFPDNAGREGHLTPSQAGEIASRSGAKRLVLTHFYPESLNSDIATQCRKTYQGELILTTDMMSLSV